jgi:hypothetical protein
MGCAGPGYLRLLETCETAAPIPGAEAFGNLVPEGGGDGGAHVVRLCWKGTAGEEDAGDRRKHDIRLRRPGQACGRVRRNTAPGGPPSAPRRRNQHVLWEATMPRSNSRGISTLGTFPFPDGTPRALHGGAHSRIEPKCLAVNSLVSSVRTWKPSARRPARLSGWTLIRFLILRILAIIMKCAAVRSEVQAIL